MPYVNKNMNKEIERKINIMLRIISESKKPVGSKEISQKLSDLGIDLTERAIRYHLKIMDRGGLTRSVWKAGRLITEKGRTELSDSSVYEKVGLVISRIESLAYQMTFDINQKSGTVIVNLSFIPKNEFKSAIGVMKEVFKNNFGLGNMIAVAKEGSELGGISVPYGKVAFGTVCSVTIHGILTKEFIPVESKFSGVLQIENNKPLRFTDFINYCGSTLDPVEIFIRSKMTSIADAVKGSGKIVASFREIPAAAKDNAVDVLKKSEKIGLGGALLCGKPGQTLLEIPIGMDRVGLVICAGLNPIAAVEEIGIETESYALACLVDFKHLKSFWDII